MHQRRTIPVHVSEEVYLKKSVMFRDVIVQTLTFVIPGTAFLLSQQFSGRF
jgi:hypothetical protein